MFEFCKYLTQLEVNDLPSGTWVHVRWSTVDWFVHPDACFKIVQIEGCKPQIFDEADNWIGEPRVGLEDWEDLVWLRKE